MNRTNDFCDVGVITFPVKVNLTVADMRKLMELFPETRYFCHAIERFIARDVSGKFNEELHGYELNSETLAKYKPKIKTRLAANIPDEVGEEIFATIGKVLKSYDIDSCSFIPFEREFVSRSCTIEGHFLSPRSTLQGNDDSVHVVTQSSAQHQTSRNLRMTVLDLLTENLGADMPMVQGVFEFDLF